MRRLFVDWDVIPDVFARREPFSSSSANLLTAVEKKLAVGFTSPRVFANIQYVLRKFTSKKFAVACLRKLRRLIHILPLTNRHIALALNSGFPDFEDALQYHSAKDAPSDYLITRNKKHYKQSNIPVCSLQEYPAMLRSQE